MSAFSAAPAATETHTDATNDGAGPETKATERSGPLSLGSYSTAGRKKRSSEEGSAAVADSDLRQRGLRRRPKSPIKDELYFKRQNAMLEKITAHAAERFAAMEKASAKFAITMRPEEEEPEEPEPQSPRKIFPIANREKKLKRAIADFDKSMEEAKEEYAARKEKEKAKAKPWPRRRCHPIKPSSMGQYVRQVIMEETPNLSEYLRDLLAEANKRSEAELTKRKVKFVNPSDFSPPPKLTKTKKKRSELRRTKEQRNQEYQRAVIEMRKARVAKKAAEAVRPIKFKVDLPKPEKKLPHEPSPWEILNSRIITAFKPEPPSWQSLSDNAQFLSVPPLPPLRPLPPLIRILHAFPVEDDFATRLRINEIKMRRSRIKYLRHEDARYLTDEEMNLLARLKRSLTENELLMMVARKMHDCRLLEGPDQTLERCHVVPDYEASSDDSGREVDDSGMWKVIRKSRGIRDKRSGVYKEPNAYEKLQVLEKGSRCTSPVEESSSSDELSTAKEKKTFDFEDEAVWQIISRNIKECLKKWDKENLSGDDSHFRYPPKGQPYL